MDVPIKTVDLDKLAEEELLREAKRGASRAASLGAMAWKKCPLQPTNKRFLFNMIQNNVSSNNLKDVSYSRKSHHKRKHKNEHTHDNISFSKNKHKDCDYDSDLVKKKTKCHHNHHSYHQSEDITNLDNSTVSTGSRTSVDS